ncbi:hypothetical protein ABXT43_00940 [Candidatus Pelagibacter sp. Uisw_114]
MNFVLQHLRIYLLKNNSFEISMTMHAIEPNNGEEEEIIKELIRVSSRGLVLIEPDYKLANTIQRKRMRKYGYTPKLRKNTDKKKILNTKKIPMKNYLSFKK